MAVADQREITEQMSSSHGSFELVVSPVVLGLLGHWIDTKAGTNPWFAVGLAVFGFVGAVVKVYLDYRFRMANVEAATRAERERREADRAERRAAEVAERAEVEQRLAAELAAAEERAATSHRSSDLESVS